MIQVNVDTGLVVERGEAHAVVVGVADTRTCPPMHRRRHVRYAHLPTNAQTQAR